MTRRALVIEEPGTIGIRERPALEPGSGEVVIRPAYCGVCGTDLELLRGEVDPAFVRYPLTLGHEWSGTIGLLAAYLVGLWSPATVTMVGRRPEQARLADSVGVTRFETDVADAGAFDLAIEAAGVPEAVVTAVAAVRRGGTVVLLGLPPTGRTLELPADLLVNNDLTIAASFGYTSA